MHEIQYTICNKCGKIIKYYEKDTVWDENYSSCSAKLVRCNECGTYNVLKYEPDQWFIKETKEKY